MTRTVEGHVVGREHDVPGVVLREGGVGGNVERASCALNRVKERWQVWLQDLDPTPWTASLEHGGVAPVNQEGRPGTGVDPLTG